MPYRFSICSLDNGSVSSIGDGFSSDDWARVEEVFREWVRTGKKLVYFLDRRADIALKFEDGAWYEGDKEAV